MDIASADTAGIPDRHVARPSARQGVPVLPDSEILIGKFTDDARDIKGNIVTVAGDAFKGKCALWTYVLAETEEVVTTFKTTDGDKPIKTRRHGRVGGRIVARHSSAS